MYYAFHSLRERLLLLVLFASIPVLSLIVYTAISQRHAAVIEAERSTLNLVSLASREQSQLVADTRQMLVTLSQLPALAPEAPVQGCRDLLGAVHQSNTHYTNIGVATLDGNIYCSAVDLDRPVNISDRSYFRRTVESRSFGIGDYQIGRLTGIRALNFGYPVLDREGAVVSVIYAALNLSWLNNLAEGIDLPAGSTMTLIDSSGTILARYPEPETWVGTSQRGSAIVEAVLQHQGEKSMVLGGLEGLTRLYSFAPLHDGATGSVYFAVGIPESEVFAVVNQSLVRNLSLMLVVVMLALAVAWFGSSALVIRPVRAITRAAHSISRGDLSARTGLYYGDDELGRLARDFDTMAASLQHVNRAMKTLSAGNRTLVRASDEMELLSIMCRTIVEVGGYHAAWIGYLDDNGEYLRPVVHAGFDEDSAVSRNNALSLGELARNHSPFTRLMHDNSATSLRCDIGETGFSPWPDCKEIEGCASSITMPLRAADDLVGFITIYTRDPDAFNKGEMELLEEFAGDIAFGIASLRTREQHRKATEKIMHMVMHDSLTDLPNHVFVQDRLKGNLSVRDADGRYRALLLLDIDRFREINSALGYSQGDLLLQEVAHRLRSVAGDSDLVARMRGDEFAILTVSHDPAVIAQTVLDELDRPFNLGGLTLAISATIGIAPFTEHGEQVEHLVRHADVAMHEAKKSGRRFLVYSASLGVDLARNLTMAGELKKAIESEELVLFYQPKVEMSDMSLGGVEALVRWRHPVRGMIPPNEFISLAEHTGLIKPLTCWVLEAALQQSREWHAQGRDICIAVNLSARNLQDALLTGQLRSLFARTGTRPEWLELELTESAIMNDPLNAMMILNSLSESGVRLYIDDFGTGYSSLAYLQRLPVNALKIDKSFVIDMLKDSDLAKIVRSTIDLAHDLDLKVVAEGVETIEVWNSLLDLGCDAAQGYFISRPLPVAEFEKWLDNYRNDPRRYIRDCR
jgi:diguanylate cyclase